MAHEKRPFEPIKNKEAGIYTCGPTVYHFAHIGNMRTYIVEDTLVRALKILGYKVKRVMNITDVGHLVSDADEGEDKMEVGSRREGKSVWDIARFYTDAFFADFKALNCLPPDIICKATDYIQEMIELGLRLEKKGFTYRTSDGIYYDTSRFPEYGKMAGKNHISGIEEGARIGINDEKRNPSDFAIWKFSPKDQKRQMEWDSPWGTGFPGWHMECSAMAMKNLGDTLDIHCGGEDHVYVHHNNEIAQSEGATGKTFSNYWMHVKFLVMGKKGKMSKSSGEFLTVSSLPQKGYEPLSYRYYCMLTHYRKQLEFTWEGVDSAAKGLKSMRALAQKIESEAEEKNMTADKTSPYYIKFISALADDINMPAAMAVMWETMRNGGIPASERLAFIKQAELATALDLLKKEEKDALPEEILGLILLREEARKARDFKKSDELRDLLLEKGIKIKDTPKGTEWAFTDKK